jgi:RNA polymerase sigma-70 factor (ECF subfamily)
MAKRSQIRALDALLVRQAKLGDRRAFADLAKRWMPRLTGHAYRLLGDQDQAVDCVQDAWVEIVKGLPKLNHDRAFPVWALRIISRRCARLISALQKDRALKAEMTLEAQSDPQEASPEFGDANAVRLAIEQLPAGQKAAVALFYLEDFSVAEIAAALDVPTGTVKTRLMHARKSLRAQLEGGGHEPS